MLKIRIRKYIGLLFSLVVLSLGYYNIYVFSKDDNKGAMFDQIIFTDATNLINPVFIHEDNYEYYKNAFVLRKFRSLFFAPGVAVADLNGDGFQDFVTVSSKASALPFFYINNNGKGFEIDHNILDKKVLPEYERYDSDVAPFLFDEDGDGDLDLLITSIRCAKFFSNNSGKFFYQPNHKLSKDCKSSTAAYFYDFDNDKKMDVLLIRYWNEDLYDIFLTKDQKRYYEMFKDNSVGLNSEHGGVSRIYFGDGSEKDLNNKENANWSFDAMVTDLNYDGIDELVLTNDFGNDRIFHFKGKEFDDITKEFKFYDRRNGMSTATNYLPNDPVPFLYTSNIWIPNYQEKGNFYWRYNPNKKELVDVSEKYNVNNCNWAWSAAFGDFNIDGYNDFYIANGFISRSGDINDDHPNSMRGNFEMATSSSLPFSDAIDKISQRVKDSEKEEDQDVEIGPGLIPVSVGGFEKDCIRIYSPKKEVFLDARKDPVLDIPWDGRAAAMIDFDNDGDLDLLVSSQNGELRLLKNNSQITSHRGILRKNWIGFNVKNYRFIRKVTLTQGDNTYYKDWHGGRSGFLTTSDSRIYFTMQDSKEVEVSFKFIDGRVVTKKFMPGKYYDLGEI